MKPEAIDIAWPDTGKVDAEFALSIAGTARDMEYFQCAGKIYRSAAHFPRNRNHVVEQFLEGDNNWLWMVDSDMMFSQGHPMKLMETAMDTGAKIVSGLAFIFKDGNQPVPSYFLRGQPPHNDPDKLYLVENRVPDVPMYVEATGLATTLVHREVFESMAYPRHPQFRWFDWISVPPMERDAVSEDTQFFLRAKAEGYATVLEPAAWTVHLKKIGVGPEDFRRFLEVHQPSVVSVTAEDAPDGAEGDKHEEV